jgi:hypothetical protein
VIGRSARVLKPLPLRSETLLRVEQAGFTSPPFASRFFGSLATCRWFGVSKSSSSAPLSST